MRWRSLLFVPALSADKLARAADRGADGLIIDLEDSILPERKAEARLAAAAALPALAASGLPLLVRVNSEAALWREDIDALPDGILAAVMLPKVAAASAVLACAQVLATRFAKPPAIVALVESPRGVLAAADIAAHPAVVALGFGAGDYAAALGVPPLPVALAGPAQHVVTCAHAWGRQCLGLAASVGDVGDLETYALNVQTARAMGFTGTVCIHPRQVPIANRGFGPTDAEVAWAERVLAADARARAEGQGAFLFEGQLVDGPVAEHARAVLDGARRAAG